MPCINSQRKIFRINISFYNNMYDVNVKYRVLIVLDKFNKKIQQENLLKKCIKKDTG